MAPVVRIGWPRNEVHAAVDLDAEDSRLKQRRSRTSVSDGLPTCRVSHVEAAAVADFGAPFRRANEWTLSSRSGAH